MIGAKKGLKMEKSDGMTRRSFPGLGAAALAGVSLAPRLSAADVPEFDDNLLVFLADIHAGVSKKCACARDKFTEVIVDILKMRPKPRNVIVFGDVAYLYGLGADYDFSRPLLRQLEDAGITVTIGMGNHDRRSEYAKRWPDAAVKSLVPGRYVHLVETSYVGFLILDSLQGADDRPLNEMGPVDGGLSLGQQEFVCDFLAKRTKPVILCAHHKAGELKVCGQPLKSLIAKTPCVAGYIHGHDHFWRRDWHRDAEQEPPHRAKRELCLPSTGMWGHIGYAICRVSAKRAVVEPVVKDFWIPRPVPFDRRPPEWDDLLAEGGIENICTYWL